MLWVGLVVGVCGWSVWRGQRRWMPGVRGAVGLLAWSVLTLTVLTTMAQLLGAIGGLRGWSVVVATALVAAAGTLVGRVDRGPDGDESEPMVDGAVGAGTEPGGGTELASWSGRAEAGVFIAAIAAVGAQWGAHLGDAYSRGMVQADNLWYHGPFVARIAQTGGLGSLAPFGYAESRYFPLNTHVLGAMLTFPTESDVLIPALNHLFAALALVAIWVIGCRRGAGVPAVLAGLAVLSLPLVSSTQPGQMYNDVAALALVLAAVALFAVGDAVDSVTPRVALSVTAFLALGWALSTKLTVVVPLAVVAVGMVIVLIRRGDRTAALVGSAAFVTTGGVWFVRNLLVTRSPMPYADLTVGSFGFERQVPATGVTLFSTLDDLGEHGRYYLDSLDVSFGPLWFVVVAGAVAGAIAGVVALHDSMRVAAVGGLLGLVAFPFMPVTGGLPFVNNLRYAMVALVLGVVIGAVVVGGYMWARRAVVGASAAVVIGDLLSPHRARVPAWPGEVWWAVGGALVAALLAAAPWWWYTSRRRTARLTPAVVGGVAALGIVAAAIALPSVEDRYLDGRYRTDDLPDAALYAAAIDGEPLRVDVFASEETYPFFGPSLDVRVGVWNDVLDEIPEGPAGCAMVRTLLSEGLVDDDMEETGRIAVGQAWLTRSITPAEREAWFVADPSVSVVYDDGDEAVYHRSAPLDPTSCPGS